MRSQWKAQDIHRWPEQGRSTDKSPTLVAWEDQQQSQIIQVLLTVQKSWASWKRPSGFHSWGLHQVPGCQSLPMASRGGCPGSTWCSCKENLGSGIWPSPTAHSLKCGEWIIHKLCHQHGSCQMIVIEISMELLQLLLVTIYFPFWCWKHGGPIQTPCSYAQLEI